MESRSFQSKGTSYFACAQGRRWISEQWEVPSPDGKTQIRGNGPPEGVRGGWEPVLVYHVVKKPEGCPPLPTRSQGLDRGLRWIREPLSL